jgi:hypothetical protein
MSEEYCEAAHIVAKCNFAVNDFQAKKLWDERFPNSCAIQEHRVMDVRNGILLSAPIHKAFDSFEFTIRKGENGQFRVETDPFTVPKILDSVNMKKIFKIDSNKKDWPGEDFLKFHNECFEAKVEMAKMKAAADEYDSDHDESNETVAVMAESIKKAQEWLTFDEYDESVLV